MVANLYSSHHRRPQPSHKWVICGFVYSLAPLLLIQACAASREPDLHGAGSGAHLENALSGTTVLIIRHAEKPTSGSGLSPEGQQRAEAYVKYFQNLRLDGQTLRIDYIVAADDSEHSQRSRLTVEPLAHALGLKPDLRFQARRPQDLAWELKSQAHGKVVLVCWHHREIPGLLEELGANPKWLLTDSEWPAQQFGWVLRLRYDQEGRLIRSQAKRIKEHLMLND